MVLKASISFGSGNYAEELWKLLYSNLQKLVVFFFLLMLFPPAKAQGKVPQLETDRKEFFESLHDLKTAIAKLDCVVRKASQGNLL